ncbi:hypothetical protein [Cohnella thermotolerans]|jgi:hypothetical protein|uniref:hypothetical protein n=1 Tax=Cohnella thermotolerans TaxID=329858 RepID=UPI00041CDB7E|nr:hypothetical protein [Cohnella thermotolerans]
MRVVWHKPNGPATEYDCPDVEQLLFLLRLVRTVYLQDKPFTPIRTGLVVGDNELSVSVWLKEAAEG